MLTQLHRAAYKGDVECVSNLLQANNINIDSATQNGETALHMACFKGHKEVARVLIRNTANFNVLTNNNQTALHMACSNGHLAVAELLIVEGAEVNAQDNEGMSALHHSAKKGSLELVTLLLSYGARIRELNNGGMTALHVAATHGQLDVVNILVDREWLLMTYGNPSSTPLHLAIQHGHREVADFLVSRLIFQCQELFRLTQHSNDITDNLNQKFAEMTKICKDLKKEIAKTRRQNLVQVQINNQVKNRGVSRANRNDNCGDISNTSAVGVKVNEENVEHYESNCNVNDKNEKGANGSFSRDRLNTLSLLLIMSLCQIIISNMMKPKSMLKVTV